MNKQLSNHQILCIELSKLPLLGQFLDFMTDPQQNAGRKMDHYWIINTQATLTNPEPTQDMNLFNAFMNQCRAHSYSSVMILNK